MNEITRIHIAKTAYDIEITAKKQLEKYIKSLEAYTQDQEVLSDIEIRMTELLIERGVKAGGVIGVEDVAAIRAQLGEPHEFADGEGDFVAGPVGEASNRRLYRSTDDAVLGGVLSGFAAFFGVNAVWPRLIFILLLFVSFGFASLVYILLWIILPPARTATEKLKLAGKDVTLESIKELNADEEKAPANRVAPLFQRILFVLLGSLSALGAVLAFVGVTALGFGAATFNEQFFDLTNGFGGLGDGNAWIVWLTFGMVLLGLLLLTALCSLVAYAFFARRATKRIIVSAVIITALGIATAAGVLAITTTQSWRVANETRSMVQDTKANLPKEFAAVNSLEVKVRTTQQQNDAERYFTHNAVIRYVVDAGPARYELNALPTTKAVVLTDGTTGKVTLEVPAGYRNSFVQPILTIYGPALESVTTEKESTDGARSDWLQFSYAGTTQAQLTVKSQNQYTPITIAGSYEKVVVQGTGSVELGESAIRLLDVQSKTGLHVSAGTVRDLIVTQPEVCPSGPRADETTVTVYGVNAGSITYNGGQIPVESYETGCGSIRVEPAEDYTY